ncbi:DUF3253 domain-containing protein [Ectothiorhodospiraceae bacterium WFHF3C12]|nr:DUF3253 domain-containing protein [Ectothiorhodospiraceae bacterium WFHF3C12]
MTERQQLEDAMLELLAHRGPGRTICPSEAARACSPSGWRELMPTAREATWSLANRGLVSVLRRGKPARRKTARGPIRIALARRPPGSASMPAQ